MISSLRSGAGTSCYSASHEVYIGRFIVICHLHPVSKTIGIVIKFTITKTFGKRTITWTRGKLLGESISRSSGNDVWNHPRTSWAIFRTSSDWLMGHGLDEHLCTGIQTVKMAWKWIVFWVFVCNLEDESLRKMIYSNASYLSWWRGACRFAFRYILSDCFS